MNVIDSDVCYSWSSGPRSLSALSLILMREIKWLSADEQGEVQIFNDNIKDLFGFVSSTFVFTETSRFPALTLIKNLHDKFQCDGESGSHCLSEQESFLIQFQLHLQQTHSHKFWGTRAGEKPRPSGNLFLLKRWKPSNTKSGRNVTWTQSNVFQWKLMKFKKWKHFFKTIV